MSDDRGGGIHFYHTDAVLHGNLILSNTVTGDGGGLFAMGYDITLDSNVFSGNRATDDGDCLATSGSTLHLIHATLARNGSSGNCIHLNSGSVSITNTLIYSHVVGVANEGGTVTMVRTMWEDVTTSTQGTVAETESFVGVAAFAADGYHITLASDAMNAGVEVGRARDVDGERRVSPPDIGADEYVLLVYLPFTLAGPP
jgi:hypothetical protein